MEKIDHLANAKELEGLVLAAGGRVVIKNIINRRSENRAT